jgi:hypothetical protein
LARRGSSSGQYGGAIRLATDCDGGAGAG